MEKELLIICATVFLYWMISVVRKKYKFFKDRNVPHTAPIFPLGNFWKVGLTMPFIEMINATYRKFKGSDVLCGFYLFTKPIYLILNVDLVKNIMVKDFYAFHDRGLYHNEKTDPLSAHLFSLCGEQWKTMRAKMTTTFSSGKIKGMMPSLMSVSNELVDVINETTDRNETINYRDVTSRYMCDIIGLVAFGLECNSLRIKESQIMKISNFLSFTDWNQRIKFIFANAYQDLSRKIGFQVTPNNIQDFFLTVVTEAVEHREKNNIERNDFLQMLIQLKNNGKLDGDSQFIGKISFTDLAAQCFVFFLAGFETSSTALSYALYELAINPQLQERTRKEIEKVLTEHDGEINYDSIMNMDFVGQVIDESLRRYTPGNVLIRMCTKEYKVPNSNHVIEKGSPVMLPMHAIHNDPEYFPNPEKFDPDRHSPEEVKKRNPFTFLPFGEGPRICMGIRFGVLQTRLGLVTILKNFKLTLNEKTIHPIRFDPKDATMTPLGGIWLNTERL